MAEIVLFHSALGLRPAVAAWAERLRAHGHIVHTPDLYDGAVFDDLNEGMRRRDEIGIPALIARAVAAVGELPERLVLAGFSMGAAAAEYLAATRPGAAGAVLMHGAVEMDALGVERWPGIPVQVHYAERDPWIDHDGVDSFVSAVRESGAPAEVYTYPIAGHLFADPDDHDHDAASADAMFARVVAFVDSLGEKAAPRA